MILMRFKTEEEAYDYWQDWYEYNGKYEGTGDSFDVQVVMFEDWLEDRVIIEPEETQ